MENEFKKKNQHIFKLNNGEIGEEAAQELADGYVDAEGVYHGVDQDERLFQQNEKLLQRLTKAASLKTKLQPGLKQALASLKIPSSSGRATPVRASGGR